MKPKVIITVLVGLLLLSLAVNIFVIWSLLDFRASAYQVVFNARRSLEILTEENITADVYVDQLIPINTEIYFDQQIDIPIDMTFPLDVIVYTTINLPGVGSQRIAIPIRGNIPIDFTVPVPVKMTVPISTEYQIQEVIPLEFSLRQDALLMLIETLENVENILR